MRYDEVEADDGRESQKQRRKNRFKHKGRDRKRSDFEPDGLFDIEEDEPYDYEDWEREQHDS